MREIMSNCHFSKNLRLINNCYLLLRKNRCKSRINFQLKQLFSICLIFHYCRFRYDYGTRNNFPLRMHMNTVIEVYRLLYIYLFHDQCVPRIISPRIYAQREWNIVLWILTSASTNISRFCTVKAFDDIWRSHMKIANQITEYELKISLNKKKNDRVFINPKLDKIRLG
jgi:hypothetical protein